MMRLASAALLLASLNIASAVTCSKTRSAYTITGQSNTALNTNAAIAAANLANTAVTPNLAAAAAPSQLTWGCQVEALDGVNTWISWSVSDRNYPASVPNSYFQVFTMWGYPCFQGLPPTINEPLGWVYKSSATVNCTSGGKYNRTHSAGHVNTVTCTDSLLNGVSDNNGGMTSCYKTNTTTGVWIGGSCSNGTQVGTKCPYGGYIGGTFYSSNVTLCPNGTLLDGSASCSLSSATLATCTNGTTTTGSYTQSSQYGNPSFLYQAPGTPAWYDMYLATPSNPSNPNAWCRSDKTGGKCSSNGFIQVPSTGSPTCIMVICLNSLWEASSLTADGAVLPNTATSCQVTMSVAVANSLADTLTTSSASHFFQFTSMLVGVFLAFLIQ